MDQHSSKNMYFGFERFCIICIICCLSHFLFSLTRFDFCICGLYDTYKGLRPYYIEYTSSCPITEVKQGWAWLVLGWQTAWGNFSGPHSVPKKGTREHTVMNKGKNGAEQGIIRCRTRNHTVPNKGACGAVCSLNNILCWLFPCFDWATASIL